MPLIRKRGLFESNRVTFLPVEQLIPKMNATEGVVSVEEL